MNKFETIETCKGNIYLIPESKMDHFLDHLLALRDQLYSDTQDKKRLEDNLEEVLHIFGYTIPQTPIKI